jgi:class 3 adenylate cyclase/tetratricopeptide (TPR) repeat protein
VRCGACSLENLRGARFCSGCGSALERVCSGCGHANGAEAQFCTACGSRLADAVPLAHPTVPAAQVRGERRHLTVLFCDMVGSTEIASRLDAEDWHAVSSQYQRCGKEAVERFGGHVAQFLGDGFFTYFGYPLAHDDGPERAVRAGIAILDALAPLNRRLEREHGVRLSVRIGVHTGEVVIGEGSGAEGGVFGETVHVAARVQQLAAPHEVLVTETTWRLVPGLFVTEERGLHELRGIPQPVRLHRVVQPSGTRGRLKAAAAHGLTPFVGREAERALLRRRWERAREGQGQLVLVTGEPGIGKSRLVQVFHEEIGDRPRTWVECATSPYHEGTPFFCITDMLQQALATQGGESDGQRLVLLERALATSGLDLAEAVPLVADLIGLELPPARYPSLTGSAGQQRQRLMTTLVRWVLGAAAVQPLVLVIEDVMWADPSTVELLELLRQQIETAPVMLLCTARPEFRCAWPPRSNFTIVTLDRLSPHEVRQLIASRTPHLVETLAARSDGVPLFAEELTQFVTDASARSGRGDVPATLHDLLAARLDRLGPARQVAQIGAVIGREFSYALLEAVAGPAVPDLGAMLARLTDAELLYARGFPPEATYVFKHALIRDAAYGSLLRARRRELHLAIARALTERFPETAEAMPELLAHHYTEAGEPESAWRQWQRAGELAVARSALREAEDHFTAALELHRALPDAPERAQERLSLQILLGQALTATRGYGAREVTEAFARARELARDVADTGVPVAVLFGVWAASAGQGEFGVARELADELLAAADRDNMPAERVWGHIAHGINCYSTGDVTRAREHFARVVDLYRAAERPASPSDPRLMAVSYAAVNSWFLGLVDEARERSREALEFARQLGNPFAAAWAGFFTAALHVVLREPRQALEHTDPLLTLCTEQQFSLFVGLLTITRGAALSEDGRHEEGVAELRKGLEIFRTTGQRVSHRLYLCWLAQAFARAGALAEASATVEEGLGMSPEERLLEPELHRLRAELLIGQGGDTAQAEASFREAIELARRLAAHSLELRAATSYARWLGRVGRADEARRWLAEPCGWFPAGLDTRDLREARALLQSLSGGAR